MLSIGEVAKESGLPVKTVRYYADIELVIPSGRSASGYRLYSSEELKRLVFVRRSRSFGFSVDECRELLSLYEKTDRSSRDVKALALQRADQIKEKIDELSVLHTQLAQLAAACKGDDAPECAILTGLAG